MPDHLVEPARSALLGQTIRCLNRRAIEEKSKRAHSSSAVTGCDKLCQYLTFRKMFGLLRSLQKHILTTNGALHTSKLGFEAKIMVSNQPNLSSFIKLGFVVVFFCSHMISLPAARQTILEQHCKMAVPNKQEHFCPWQ